MNSVLISNESLEQLKCHICKNFLSIFPIHLNENFSICGRCIIPENEGNFIRNYSYEHAVRLTTFPCYYTQFGCPDHFRPEELKNHERVCHFRKIKCPNFQKCPWIGFMQDLYQHYENKHKTFILKDGKFEIDFVNNYEDNFLLIFDNELFIIKIKCNSDKLICKCSVYYLGQPSIAALFNYCIIVENTSKSLSKTYSTKQTLPIDLDNENTTEIKMNELKEVLQDPVSIIAKIEIFEMNQISIENNNKDNDKKSDIDLEMISELECPVCMDYMISPIYQCIAGHSLCETCKKTNNNCPTCKQEIQNTRNYGLEKLTNFLYYPCKYRDLGCNYTSKTNTIRKHEEFCMFTTHNCPVNDYFECNWLGPKHDIVEHVKTLHYDNYLQLEQVSVPFANDDFNNSDDDVFILKFGLDLFKLHYKYDKDDFLWSMQLIGPEEECKKFMFEIDIVDNTGNNRRAYFKSFCSVLTNKDACFGDDPSNYISVGIGQIENMIADNLVYRTRIIKC